MPLPGLLAVREDRMPPIAFPLAALVGIVFMLGGGQAGSVAAVLGGILLFGAATVGSTVVRFLSWVRND